MLTLSSHKVDWGRVFGPHKQISIPVMHARIMEQQNEREHTSHHSGRRALVETASAFVSSGAPRQLQGGLRRLQRIVDKMPAVRKVFAQLVESSAPNDKQFVAKNGLRALDLRPRRQTGVLAMTPEQIWDAARNGNVRVVETAPQRRTTGKRLLNMTPEQIWQACRS